ncbi:E3 ubiquitin-protein ligase RNF212B-like isoform 4-T4 [Ara ararauna]
MRPQEKLFFKSPAAIALQHLASITQGARVAAPGEHRAASSSALPRLARGQQVAPSIWESMGGYGAPHCRSSPPCAPHRSSTPRPVGVTSPAHTVTPQPRRQLSSQVVSRSAPLEPPPTRSTPLWHLGSAYGEGRTPSGSSAGERTPNLAGFYPNLHVPHSPWP